MRTILNRIKRGLDAAFSDPIETRNSKSNNSVFVGLFGTNSEEIITEDEAMQIPAVAAAIELISSTIANLPIKLYQVDQDNGKINPIEDQRVKLLNVEPNAYMNGYNLKKQMVKDYLFYGRTVVAKQGTLNRTETLHLLPSKNVTVSKYVQNGFVSSCIISYDDPLVKDDNSKQQFEYHKVIMPLRDSDDGITTKGILDTNSKILRKALSEMEYSDNILENGILPMSTLETDTKLSKEAVDRLQESLNNKYGGSTNAGKTMILEQGLKYKPISLKPNELELTASRQNTLSDIARIFNIPESMINSEANKYASNEQNNIHFLQYCISPIIASFESALNKSLLLEREKGNMYFEFDTSSVLQTTEVQKIEAISKGLDAGIFTINEARRKLSLTDITDRDFYSGSLGKIFIDTKSGLMIVPNLGKVIDPKKRTGMEAPETQLYDVNGVKNKDEEIDENDTSDINVLEE